MKNAPSLQRRTPRAGFLSHRKIETRVTMKTKNTRYLRGLALVAGTAFLFTANPLVRAADKKAHGEHGDMAKPATSKAALEQIHMLHGELAAQLKGKKLDKVHDTAEKLTAVVNALPGVSKDLAADKLKRVEGAVKNLAKALDALHDAADDGKQAEAEKQFTAVESLLKLIDAQYAGMAGKAGRDH